MIILEKMSFDVELMYLQNELGIYKHLETTVQQSPGPNLRWLVIKVNQTGNPKNGTRERGDICFACTDVVFRRLNAAPKEDELTFSGQHTSPITHPIFRIDKKENELSGSEQAPPSCPNRSASLENQLTLKRWARVCQVT